MANEPTSQAARARTTASTRRRCTAGWAASPQAPQATPVPTSQPKAMLTTIKPPPRANRPPVNHHSAAPIRAAATPKAKARARSGALVWRAWAMLRLYGLRGTTAGVPRTARRQTARLRCVSHPNQGLPPADPRAGRPAAAASLRGARDRLARVALEEAVKRDPTLSDRYTELELRHLLRDYDRHLEQLAQALETGQVRFVTEYAEWLMPLYRRRHVQAKDLANLVRGLQAAATAVISPADLPALRESCDAWVKVLEFHRRLPGDHPGNAVVRFAFKGAGILDDSVV